MTRIRLALATAVATLAVAAPAAQAEPYFEIGEIPSCLQGVPAAVAGPLGRTLEVRTRVLLDQVPLARGEAIMRRAAEVYMQTGVNIKLTSTFEAVSFSGTEAQELIQKGKDHTGGRRPAGIDLVYVLTDADITADGDPGVAGMADCIGGVIHPETAFAVGEAFEDDVFRIFGAKWFIDTAPKIVAHELAHLLGAHHHYGNCAEGLPSSSDVAPCTLMFIDAGLIRLRFSALEGAAVRGHTEAYLYPARKQAARRAARARARRRAAK